MKPKPKHGGLRPGQGRPPIKPGEKSARYALVMPESLKAAAVEMGPDQVRDAILSRMIARKKAESIEKDNDE